MDPPSASKNRRALAVLPSGLIGAWSSGGSRNARAGSSPEGSGTRERFRRERFSPLRFGGALALVVIAMMGRPFLTQSFGATTAIFITLYPATFLAALLWGLGPGIFASVLSVSAAAYDLLEPSGIRAAGVRDVVDLTFLLFSGIGVSALAGARDRTSRRASENARKASLYARSLIEACLDPLVAISPEGKILDVNQATEEATGVPRSGLIGTDFARYLTDPDQARAGFLQVFEQGQITDYPLAIQHASGRVTDVLCHARTFADENGVVTGVLASARDVTERKRAEAELGAYRQHLEELVEKRTVEIQTAYQTLEAANQELETFAYSVSHDLRTPLRAVDGFSSILLEDCAAQLDAEGRRVVGVIREGTRRMGQMIDDILAFSRAGRLELSMRRVDMEELVGTALKDLKPLLAASGIEVKIKPLPAAHGDAPMLQRVWVNLLENAIKFTRPKSAGAIEVGARPGESETIYYVRDNGVGFDMQYSHKLFGVFQRLHGQDEFPGTGIGLAIVKRVVTRHGGRVWAEAKAGEGATVSFALPNGAPS